MIRNKARNYLATVAEALRHRPRWRVRRGHDRDFLVFIGDVDRSRPERLPAAARPERHGLLQQIYGDAPVGELNTLAAVHDIDHPDIEAQATVLVTHADAS